MVLREQGVRGLWRGTTPTVIRLALGAGTHFPLLERFKAVLQVQQPDGSMKLTPLRAALAGGCGVKRVDCAKLLCKSVLG